MATVTSQVLSRGDEPYPLTAEEFLQIVDADILPERRRIYLWDGRLYEKMAKKQGHSISQAKLGTVLVKAIPEGWFVSAENPLRVDTVTVPLPDLVIVRGKPDDYPKRPPHAHDLALLVEVMNTSRKKDLRDRLRVYAAAGVRTYWVIDVKAQVVHCFRRPAKLQKKTGLPGYRTSTRHGLGEWVELEIPDGAPLRFLADDLLPAEPSEL